MISISRITFTEASVADRHRGLLGYVSLLLDGTVRVDGIAVRRTRAGELRLSFPARRDHRGQEHPYVHPIDDATRVAIERAVFEALGLLGVKP